MSLHTAALLLGVWAGPWIGLQLNRKDLAGYAGRGPSLASPCADVDRLSDRRFVVIATVLLGVPPLNG